MKQVKTSEGSSLSRRVLIVAIIAAISTIVVFVFLTWTSRDNVSNDILTPLAAVVGTLGTLGTLIGALVTTFLMREENKKIQTQSKDIVMRLRLVDDEQTHQLTIQKEQQQQQQHLLEIEKQQLEVEKQQLEVEKQQQNIAWLKEALSIAEISPRAAILIAWLGVEQEIQRAVNRLGLEESKQSSTFNNIKLLRSSKYLDQDVLETLKEMSMLRNKVAHGMIENDDITGITAIDYVQLAIDIVEKISSTK